MDGRRFFSGLNKLFHRKPSDASRSALTTRVSARQSITESSIGDVITKPPFERSEMDRLVFEQGLTSPRATSAIEKRQVRDKSYYMGLLFRKGYQIRSEVQKLLQEGEKMRVDQLAYDGLKATAEGKALELKRLQEALCEYNTVDEWIHTDKTFPEAKSEYERTKVDNSSKAREVMALFESVKQKSEAAKELDTEVSERDSVADIVASAEELKELDRELKSELDRLESEARELRAQGSRLESRCDALRRGCAVGLLQELSAKEAMRDTLRREHQGKADFQRKKKEYSELVRCMRRQLREVKRQIDQVESDLEGGDVDVKGNSRVDMISKLKEREKILESFFESYPSKKNDLLDECGGHQGTVLSVLSEMSRKLSLGFGASRNGKEERAKESLRQELAALLEKQTLEEKLREEVAGLKRELALKREEIRSYSDLETLRASKEEQKEELESELREAREQSAIWREVLEGSRDRHEALRESARKCRVHAELGRLERRWRELEGENFALKEWMEEEKAKRDYSRQKRDVLEAMRGLNASLCTAES